MSKKKVERLKSLIECSICLEQYVEPKMLACAHEFCKLCIEQLMQFREDGSAEVICPMRCANKTVLHKDQTVNDLPASLNFKNILEVLMEDELEKTNRKEAFCSYTKKCKKKPVKIYCCGKLMCSACFVKHSTTNKNSTNKNNSNNSDNSCDSNKTKTNKTKRSHSNNGKIPPPILDSAHQQVSVDYDKSDNKLKVVCNEHRTFCRSVCEDQKFLCAYCENRDDTHRHHSRKRIDNEIEFLQRLLCCESSYRKRLLKLKEITQEYLHQSKEKFHSALKQKKAECLRLYSEYLDEEESKLLKKYKVECDPYIEDEFGHLLSPEYCEDMLSKEGVELFLQKEDIFDQVAQSGSKCEVGILDLFYDDGVSFLSASPMGNLIASMDCLSYEKVELQSTVKFVFATEGQVEKAILGEGSEHYAIHTDPQVASALKVWGNEQFKKESLIEAKVIYSKAIIFCPTGAAELAIFYQNRAAVYEQLYEDDDCINDCTEALKVNPRYVKALQRRSRMYHRCGDVGKAYDDVVLAKLFDNPLNKKKHDLVRFYRNYGRDFVYEYLAEDPMILSIAPPHLIRSYLADFGGLDIFDTSCDPNIPEHVMYRTIVQDLKEEKFEKIETRCSELMRLKGDHRHLALLLRGSLRHCKNDISNALRDFDLLVTQLDDSDDKSLKIHALVRRACLRKASKDYTGYEEDFEEALLLDESNPIIYHIRAEFEAEEYDSDNNDDLVEEDYQEAISNGFSFIPPLLGLGEYLMLRGKELDRKEDLEKADELFKKAVTLDPTNSDALSKYGQFLLKIGKANEAFHMIEKAVSVAPSRPQPYAAKADVLLEKGNITQADKLCEKALEMDCYCYEVHRMSGKIALADGRYTEALASFNKSLTLSPRSRNVLVQTVCLRKECEAILRLQEQ